ncbi:hypothetical protein IFM89_017299 [Coptis chinensis]|uniref:Toprim domain-containing protein n=1 Tax=Coptis chinensis TaxID=261450 RepID=A0A835H601_9MAGN|nr:hypothetical protein IFM89_017299 [Coptis chinensis]
MSGNYDDQSDWLKILFPSEVGYMNIISFINATGEIIGIRAILPLRGKILNIERKDEAVMYKKQEIQNLILALGLGVKGEDFKKEALRYHKIIIMTDADVDGAHVRTLLLTFFYRYQKALFDEGCIYVGVPPVYKVERGKQAHYCYDKA